MDALPVVERVSMAQGGQAALGLAVAANGPGKWMKLIVTFLV
jgi:hypothetical protein